MKTFKEFLNEDRWYEDPTANYGYNTLTFKQELEPTEGFESKVKPDPKGIPTVGIGAKVDKDLPGTLRAVFPDKPKGWEYDLVKGRASITREEGQQLKDYQADQKFAQIRKALNPDIFDRLHNDVQVGLADAHYRGSMLGPKGSPKTMQLIRQGNLRAAADEFLDNDEYRFAKANPKKLGGVATRMEKFAQTLRDRADYQNTELPPAGRQ